MKVREKITISNDISMKINFFIINTKCVLHISITLVSYN